MRPASHHAMPSAIDRDRHPMPLAPQDDAPALGAQVRSAGDPVKVFHDGRFWHVIAFL